MVAGLKPSQLTDAELFACLLRGKGALDRSRAFLHAVGGLPGIARRADEVAEGLPGKDLEIFEAVRELSARLARVGLSEGDPCGDPAKTARYLFLRHARFDQEIVGALYLNSRNQILSDETLFVGTLTRAVVEPRTILRRALALGAAAFILFHTHPSGDPTPSAEDRLLTRRLA